jgi:hypothetical protein
MAQAHQTLRPVPLLASSDVDLVKAKGSPAGNVADALAAVKGFPSHHVGDFQFSRAGFFSKLDRLMAEPDDVDEFIHLETSGRHYILRIRNR